MAVSAFHDNSDSEVSNMECDTHKVPPPFGDVDNRLPLCSALCSRYHNFQQIATFVSSSGGERSNAAPAEESAAVLTSHAPHDSKARLQNGHDSQKIHGEAMYTAPDSASAAALRATSCQWAGARGKAPRPFLLGGVRGDVLFPRKENIPP